MAKETVQLMFDGVMYTCKREEDRNGEYLFVAENGRFAKFPKDANLEEAIALHNEANSEELEKIEPVTYGEVIHFDKDGNEVERVK